MELSPTLISNVTEEVMEEVKTWQGRPLDAVYPIVYLDALLVKVRDAGHIRNRAIYVAIGVNLQGNKEVLGLWTGEAEGAKFWLQVLTDLKNRGVVDIFIACVDGLTGFPKAIETVFPRAQVPLCIVHQVRASLNYVSWKQRKAVAADLQVIYRANTTEDAYCKLEAFAEKWDGAYPTISQMWRRNWEHLTPFFAYPADIRKVIYTTNTIESLNMSLRKVIKTRGSFPSPDAALKLLFLALEHIAKSGPCRCRTGRRPYSVSRFCWKTAFRQTHWYEPEGEEQSEESAAEPGFRDERRVALGFPKSRCRSAKTY